MSPAHLTHFGNSGQVSCDLAQIRAGRAELAAIGRLGCPQRLARYRLPMRPVGRNRHDRARARRLPSRYSLFGGQWHRRHPKPAWPSCRSDPHPDIEPSTDFRDLTSPSVVLASSGMYDVRQHTAEVILHASRRTRVLPRSHWHPTSLWADSVECSPPTSATVGGNRAALGQIAPTWVGIVPKLAEAGPNSAEADGGHLPTLLSES